MKQITFTAEQIDIIINALEDRQNLHDELVEYGHMDESESEEENNNINEILSKFY
jgi:hypothetical protein